MSTLLIMRTEIKNLLTISGTTKDSIIDGFIRAAIRQNQRKRFWFLRATGTAAISVSGTTASLPSDFGLMDSVDLLTATSRYGHGNGFDLLEYETLKQRFFMSATLTAGRPQAAAVLGNTLYLSHTSDIAYTAAFTYFRKDATLPTADGNTSVWFDDGYDAIRSLAQHLFEKEHLQNPEADAEIPAGYMKMLSRSHERIESGEY